MAETRLVGDRSVGALESDDRAVVSIVGKLLEIGVVVLFVAMMTTALHAGVVPEYRAETAVEIGDRTLVAAAGSIEGAVPPAARTARADRRVELPATIHGADYRVEADGGGLRLDHPRDDVGGTRRLALPDRVTRVDGRWRSGAETVVVVTETPDGVIVELVNR